jgi:hypothetical protein
MALDHPLIHEVAEVAGYVANQGCWKFQKVNVIKVLKLAKNIGQSDNVKLAFLKSLMVAVMLARQKG